MENRDKEEYTGYLLVYFKTESETMFYGLSRDGLNWEVLNQGESILIPSLGNKSIRDPHVIRMQDGSFKMICTDSWRSQNILVWDSKDLVNWENERLVHIAPEGGLNTWAPEAFYDEEEKKYVVFWSTSLAYPWVHKIYKSYTKDFIKFTPAELLFDPGYSVIDSTMIKHENTYYMYFKDEREDMPNEKSIKLATSDRASKGYPGVDTPEATRLTETWVEGPIVIKSFKEDKWYLYYDEYTRGRWGCSVSENLEDWTKLSYDEFHLPQGVRHGGIIPLTEEEYQRLEHTF